MRGFTVTELIVVAAIIALIATIGARYYFPYAELYRFENCLLEFKSSINLARVRSLSGLVSMGGVVGDTPVSIFINQIGIDANNNITLTPAASQNLTAVSKGSYVTLLGFCPSNTSQSFPYFINGGMYQVTGVTGNLFNLAFADMSPTSGQATVATTNLNPTAVAFLKYAVQITPVASVTGGNYARAYESGPLINFQYVSSMIQVAFQTSGSGATQSQGTIVFDKGLTAGEKTYSVTFSLLKSGAVASTVNCTVLPAGEVR